MQLTAENESTIAALNERISELKSARELVKQNIGKRTRLATYLEKATAAIASYIERMKAGYRTDQEFDIILEILDEPFEKLYRSALTKEKQLRNNMAASLILKGIRQIITDLELYIFDASISCYKYC